MTTLREAAQQALEALQAYGSHAPNCDHLMLLTSLPPQRKPCSCGLGANITALRAALAEPVKTEMTRDDIIRLAREAGYEPLVPRTFADDLQEIFIQKFATLVAAEKDKEIERLREALKKYGQHRSDCAVVLGGYQCTCGFNQQEQPR